MKRGAPRQPIRDRLLARYVISGECWIYTGAKTRDGYGVLGNGRNVQVRAHRASYQEFVGPIPAGMLVCHKCDTPLCIRPEHLFLGSPKENTGDMLRKGRKAVFRGATHPNAKLSDADVLSIKRLRESGRTLKYIAERFGISFQHVSAIAKGDIRASA